MNNTFQRYLQKSYFLFYLLMIWSYFHLPHVFYYQNY